MKIKGHTLSAWLNHPLFKLLPPKLYLRSQGIEYYSEPPVIATITYALNGEEKQAQVKFGGGAWAIIKMFPLWFEYGFCEPVPELSPYIPRHLDNERYYIPPANIQKVEWYDPVLEESFSFEGGEHVKDTGLR